MTLTPNFCFTVSTFKAFDAYSGAEISDYISVDDAGRLIKIETNDRNLVKKHTIKIKAMDIKAIIPESNEQLT